MVLGLLFIQRETLPKTSLLSISDEIISLELLYQWDFWITVEVVLADHQLCLHLIVNAFIFYVSRRVSLLLALLQNSSVEIAFKNTCWAQWLTPVILEI